MSPSWRAELRVGLCPGRLVMARYPPGLRRAPAENSIQPVDIDPVDAIRQLACDCAISIILSNHFVRYAVLRPSRALVSESHWSAYARHTLTCTYGDGAAQWEVRVSKARAGRPRVASAVDRTLLESLRSVPGVSSMQPYLMAAFNSRKRAMPPSGAWFVVQEQGRLTIGLIVDDEWKLVRNRQTPQDWQAALPELLDREAVHEGSDTTTAVVCSESPIAEQIGRYRILDATLPPGVAAEARPHAMTLGL